jgi:hypothetical protein
MSAVHENWQQNNNKGAAIERCAFAPYSCMELRLGGFSSHRSRQAVGIACGILHAENQQTREDWLRMDSEGGEMEIPVWYHLNGQGGHALT